MPSTGTQIAELAAAAELFHTAAHEAFAAIEVGNHHEVMRVGSAQFARWLRQLWFEKASSAAPRQALLEAVNLIEAKACYGGPETEVFTRIAGDEGSVYLDLANAAWEAVEVTPHGWQIIPNSPVRFRRPRGMDPLPRPLPGGTVEMLRPFVNVSSTEDWILIASWVVAGLRPQGPFPVLGLHGEQGSAKSTTARILRSLVDPNSAALRTEPACARDLMISATNSWLQVFDNISHLPPWLSDALCRLATGGGFATRQLYTDAEEAMFEAQRPVLLNGIGDVATRGDLVDRSLMLTLPRIPEERRRAEADFWRDFERVRPAILGALLDVLSIGLRVNPGVRLRKAPRMADFATWSAAVSFGLGWKPGDFSDAYAGNRQGAQEVALEGSRVALAVRTLLETENIWEGTASKLLERLLCGLSAGAARAAGFPASPRALADELRRLAPNLRACGVSVDFHRGHRGRRIIKLSAIVDAIVTSVTCASGVDPAAPGADDGKGAVPLPSSPDDRLRHREADFVTAAIPEDAGTREAETQETQETQKQAMSTATDLEQFARAVDAAYEQRAASYRAQGLDPEEAHKRSLEETKQHGRDALEEMRRRDLFPLSGSEVDPLAPARLEGPDVG